VVTSQLAMRSEDFVDDPLHVSGWGENVRWSRVNLGEFIVGVPTPLTWDLWDTGTRNSGHEIYYRMGLAKRSELAPRGKLEATTSILNGWPVCNVAAMRKFIDRAGKDAGDSFERNMLGDLTIEGPSIASENRRFVSTIKTAYMLWVYQKELDAMVADIEVWWRTSTRRVESASFEEAISIVDDAFSKYPSICVTAGSGGTIGGQIVFSALEKAIPKSCHHLMTRLVSAGEGLVESKMIEALWRVSRNQLSTITFLETYGFYGNNVGECANHSWREDQTVLKRTIESYQSDPGLFDPAERQTHRQNQTSAALSELREQVSASRMRWINLLLKNTEKITRWREDGKTCTLMVHDAVRAGARAAGKALAQAGHIEDPDDTFYLTREELLGAPFPNLKETVLFRRARRTFYEKLEIPEAFVGSPPLKTQNAYENVACIDNTERDQPVQGVGVSPGSASGVARIVSDPNQCDQFERGDILVCRNTDPSWAPIFTLAGGIVTDMGGMLSHGAIIARELSVPCVVNTKVGTKTIQDGAWVHIDGTTGQINVDVNA